MFPYIHSLSDILAVFIVTWFYLITEEKLQPELPISYHSPLGLLGWLPLEINGTFCKVSFFSKGFCIILALGNRWDIIKVGINIFGWVEFEHACHFIKYVTHKDAFASHLLRDMKKPKIEDAAKIVENTVCNSKHYWETHPWLIVWAQTDSLSCSWVCSKCGESWKSWFFNFHMSYILSILSIQSKYLIYNFVWSLQAPCFGPKTSIIGCVREEVHSQVALRPVCFLTSVCWYSH